MGLDDFTPSNDGARLFDIHRPIFVLINLVFMMECRADVAVKLLLCGVLESSETSEEVPLLFVSPSREDV